MKYYYLIVVALLFTACSKPPKVELTVKAAGITSGTVIINQNNQMLLSQNIKDGDATISKAFEAPGYFNITVVDNNKPLSYRNSFEMYLENGSYTVNVKPASKGAYPSIVTASQTQLQLSDYYKTENDLAGALNHTIDSLITYLDTREARVLSKKAHTAFTDKTRGYQIERRKLEPEILNAYIAKHPDNVVAAHIMAQQYLDEYPVEYNSIFKKLTEKAKSTDDGIKVTNKLSILTKLLPGADAPPIAGFTPNGKVFDKKTITAKVILVEFWTSTSQLSEMNHSKMLNGLILTDSDKKSFKMLSIATDGNKQVWERAVKLSRLTWPQVADFKGDSSPNVANWQIKAVPSYFLVDGQWKILKANIDLVDVDQFVHDYLAKKG
nr:hypothetical protein [Mucilaginibacter sp. L294]